MPRIAHISDIHFGPTFDTENWKKIRSEIESFAPDMLVVSGDLVDHPLPFGLLAVKCELESLSKNSSLFIVPGNHDVRMWGNVVYPWRSGWFERIMFNDTAGAKNAIEGSLGISLGLNEECKQLSLGNKFKRLDPRNSIRWNVPKNKCDGRPQSCDLRKNGGWPITSIHRRVAISCFDSNPPRLRSWAFASGEIGPSQVTRLGGRAAKGVACTCAACPRRTTRAPGEPEEALLLRVAVVHHHPLPIALARAARTQRVQEGRVEPFLVLRDSGDFLHRLQELKFDLVLHGHKHKPQLARIELRESDLEAHALVVLAAGSVAKTDEVHNTLYLIETESNGRLNMRSLHQGEQKKLYRESLMDLKQRASNHAAELTKRAMHELLVETRIDGVGHAWNRHRYSALQALSGEIKDLPFRVTMPSYGIGFEDRIRPDDNSVDRIKVSWIDDKEIRYDLSNLPEKRDKGYCLIEFNQMLKAGSPHDRQTFGINTAVANAIAMTRWELTERKRVRSSQYADHETIWRYVNHPIGNLILHLTLPKELDGITPEVRCLRHKSFPEFPLTFNRGVFLRPSMEDFQLDEDLQVEEARKLRYKASERMWSLEVERPLPGYVYELRWRLPDMAADDEVAGETREYQTMLEGLGERAKAGNLGTGDHNCVKKFNEVADLLMDHYRSRTRDEQQAAFLMVYRPSDLNLHPVLMRLRNTRGGSFSVPMGDGVAGAAFVRRRVVAWGQDPRSESLVRPVPVPGLDAQHILALPIYYQHDRGALAGKLDLQPGAVVGVLTLASSSEGSKIRSLLKNPEQAEPARKAAQLMVFEILRLL